MVLSGSNKREREIYIKSLGQLVVGNSGESYALNVAPLLPKTQNSSGSEVIEPVSQCKTFPNGL
jgi:hypothetical protein